MNSPFSIEPEERSWAVVAHLSGLAFYLIPFGGIIAPIALIFAKSDSPVVSSIAKQALYLNIAVLLGECVTGVLAFFFAAIVIGIPLAILLGLVGSLIGLAALVLPIVGAVKASSGEYFRYPFVGRYPVLF